MLGTFEWCCRFSSALQSLGVNRFLNSKNKKKNRFMLAQLFNNRFKFSILVTRRTIQVRKRTPTIFDLSDSLQ